MAIFLSSIHPNPSIFTIGANNLASFHELTGDKPLTKCVWFPLFKNYPEIGRCSIGTL
jgi:hypothetical protein